MEQSINGVMINERLWNSIGYNNYLYMIQTSTTRTRGPVCLQCDQVAQPSDCKNIKRCGDQEVDECNTIALCDKDQTAIQTPAYMVLVQAVDRAINARANLGIQDLYVTEIASQIPVYMDYVITVRRDTTVAVLLPMGSTCAACVACIHGICHTSHSGYYCSCDSGFTGSLCDTGDPATRVITVSHFDIFPKPIAIPGNITTDYDITIHRRIPTNTHYRLNVTMEKKLLGNWHSVPCSRGVGTW
ncbi:SLIT2 [Mytilus edulis]|uniref:SLIT2 n=1 Tax=Mytilus edulis TaxID=6550 RepID=A0A8S3T7R8_MYTED|nr:SLIT2 [Mytilus edulis]